MDILTSIDTLLQSNPLLVFAAVFLGGLTTAANPCVLVTIPLVMGYVGGFATESKMKAFGYSLAFTIGLATTFTALGLIASLVGGMFGDIGDYWKYIAAGVAVVMGLYLLGAIPLKFPEAKMFQPKKKGVVGSFLLGMLFGVVSSPCATPVLAVVLALVSAQGKVLYGTSLLFTYALGHCALLLLAGTFTGIGIKLIESKGLASFARIAKPVSGAILLLVAVYIVL
jgi:cytochrome c biogenesis protein CcdA